MRAGQDDNRIRAPMAAWAGRADRVGMTETATLAHEKGFKNILVSNGFQSPQCLKALGPLIDAANIDLKAMIGSNRRAVKFARFFESNSILGFYNLGYLDNDNYSGENIKILGKLKNYSDIVRSNVIDVVVVVLPIRSCYDDIMEIIAISERHADLKDKYSVLEKLRAEYDYIFCNITPIKDSADLVFLNLYVDRILFFVEADRTKRQVVKYNFDILIQYGFSKISFVLNKRRFYIPKFLYKYV